MAKKKRPSNSARSLMRRTSTPSPLRNSLDEAARVPQWRPYVAAWKFGRALGELEYLLPRAAVLGFRDWDERSNAVFAELLAAGDQLGLERSLAYELSDKLGQQKEAWRAWQDSPDRNELTENFYHPFTFADWCSETAVLTRFAINVLTELDSTCREVRCAIAPEAYADWRVARHLVQGRLNPRLPDSWSLIVQRSLTTESVPIDLALSRFGGESPEQTLPERNTREIIERAFRCLETLNQNWYQELRSYCSAAELASGQLPTWEQWRDSDDGARDVLVRSYEEVFLALLSERHPVGNVIHLYEDRQEFSINGGGRAPLTAQCFKIIEILLANPGRRLSGKEIYRLGRPVIVDRNVPRVIRSPEMPAALKALINSVRRLGSQIDAVRGI